MKFLYTVMALSFMGFMVAAVWLGLNQKPTTTVAPAPTLVPTATTPWVSEVVERSARVSEFPRGVWKTNGENLYFSVLGLLPHDSQSPDDIEVTWREVGPTRDLCITCLAKEDFNFKQQGTSPAIGNSLQCRVYYKTSWGEAEDFPLEALPLPRDLYFTYLLVEGGLKAEFHYITHEGWAEMLTAGEFRRSD